MALLEQRKQWEIDYLSVVVWIVPPTTDGSQTSLIQTVGLLVNTRFRFACVQYEYEINGIRWSTTRNIEVLRWSVSYSTVTKPAVGPRMVFAQRMSPVFNAELLDAVRY